jgi:DNA-binding NtrC family response regulator
VKCSDFTILVAEDDLNLMKVYEKSLSAEGYRLILAESEVHALLELEKAPVDLLITDINMKTMTAFDMLPIIQKDHPKLPVIVVSGSYDWLTGDSLKNHFGSVKRFFKRPVSMDVLKQNILEILNVEDF